MEKNVFLLRFNLHNNWPDTFFVLNLAFADLFYCATVLPIDTIVYMRKKWDWGLSLCKLHANNIKLSAYSAWMSVAMVAFSRFITVKSSGKSTLFKSRRNRILAFFLIRIYALILLIPDNSGVSCIDHIKSCQIVSSCIVGTQF